MHTLKDINMKGIWRLEFLLLKSWIWLMGRLFSFSGSGEGSYLGRSTFFSVVP